MSAALRTTCRAGKGFSPGSGGRNTTEAETAGVSVDLVVAQIHSCHHSGAGSAGVPLSCQVKLSSFCVPWLSAEEKYLPRRELRTCASGVSLSREKKAYL